METNKSNLTSLAVAIGARETCNNKSLEGRSDSLHFEKMVEVWENRINEIMDTAPSGSGLDNGGLILDLENSNGDKLVFHADYHHMDENGMYDGWTSHKFTVTPSFESGYHVSMTGPDRNGIKSYLRELLSDFLDTIAPVTKIETK